MRVRRPARSLAAALAVAICGAVALAGQEAPADATDVTAAELAAVFALIGDSIDQQVKVVDVGGANVGVGVLERGPTRAEGETVRGLVHHDVAEIYYVLEGSGELVTGATLEEGVEIPESSAVVGELVGPSSTGPGRGGTTRTIRAGDVVVIPAGVFHAFRRIDERIRYLSFRVDPERALPAGYLHPSLR